jgi:Ca2+-transporting ATPase
VVREGTRKRIPRREVVRGDLVVLSEGDRVLADSVLRQPDDLQADESLLTGESVTVRKVLGAVLGAPAQLDQHHVQDLRPDPVEPHPE